jgi:transcriptional regulator with XRE-family HTH domain
MSTKLDQIGLRLRRLRQHRRKSQHVLAATLLAFKVPITRDMLANWETCRSDVPARFIPFLAYALDAEVTDFLPNLNRNHVNELVRGRMTIEPRMKEGGRDRHAVFSAPKTPLRQPRSRRAAASPT